MVKKALQPKHPNVRGVNQIHSIFHRSNFIFFFFFDLLPRNQAGEMIRGRRKKERQRNQAVNKGREMRGSDGVKVNAETELVTNLCYPPKNNNSMRMKQKHETEMSSLTWTVTSFL